MVRPARDHCHPAEARTIWPLPGPCNFNHSATATAVSAGPPRLSPEIVGTSELVEVRGKRTPSPSNPSSPVANGTHPIGRRLSTRMTSRAGHASRWMDAWRTPGDLAISSAIPGASMAHRGRDGRGRIFRRRSSRPRSVVPVKRASPCQTQPGAAQKANSTNTPMVSSRPLRRRALLEALTFTGVRPRVRGHAPRDACGCRGLRVRGPGPWQ